MKEYKIEAIAHIRSAYKEKFGIPRQSNVVGHVRSRIVFEEAYRNADALRGLEGYDYAWLIWVFSENLRDGWSPTVRPPRLGGNHRMGVFATRSPFRPNGLGLSSVRIVAVEQSTTEGPVITVEGADLMDGTPIVDIKPYLPYTDAHPEARSGFAGSDAGPLLEVVYAAEALKDLNEDEREALVEVLRHDPRPQYHHNPERVYGLRFMEFNVRFRVADNGFVEILDARRES